MLYKSSICRFFFSIHFLPTLLIREKKISMWREKTQTETIEKYWKLAAIFVWNEVTTKRNFRNCMCVCVCEYSLKRYFNNAKWKISNITIVCAISDKTCSYYTHTWPNPIHLNEMKLGCFWFFFSFSCVFPASCVLKYGINMWNDRTFENVTQTNNIGICSGVSLYHWWVQTTSMVKINWTIVF